MRQDLVDHKRVLNTVVRLSVVVFLTPHVGVMRSRSDYSTQGHLVPANREIVPRRPDRVTRGLGTNAASLAIKPNGSNSRLSTRYLFIHFGTSDAIETLRWFDWNMLT